MNAFRVVTGDDEDCRGGRYSNALHRAEIWCGHAHQWSELLVESFLFGFAVDDPPSEFSHRVPGCVIDHVRVGLSRSESICPTSNTVGVEAPSGVSNRLCKGGV